MRGWKEAIMAKTAIHRSNSNVNAAQMSRFLFWAKNNPEEAFRQAQEEQETKPWMLRALRSDEGWATAEAIKASYLDAMVEARRAEAVATNAPAKLAAQARLNKARKCYAEVESALRPRRRRHR